MRVFLLNPPYLPEFIRSGRWTTQSISGSNWYPIWLGYCTGLLEKHGYKVKLLDALIDKLSVHDTLRVITEFEPQLTVVYTSIDSLHSDVRLAEKIKELTKSYIVFVGPWCSSAPEEIINTSPAIDALTIGEFDYTILELAQGKPKEQIAGLWWKEDEAVVTNTQREPVKGEELESFPFVTDVYRRHLRIRNYFQAPLLYPFIDLFTGRGCNWGRCSFCLWPYVMGKGNYYRTRSVKNVIEELKFIKKELPFIKEVFFQDDTLPRDRAREISQAILSNDIKIKWSCFARADLDYHTLKLMKQAGCRMMNVGYESSDPTILKMANKGITPQLAEEFTYNAYKLGLLIHADFLIGLPGETPETIKKTIKWAKSLPAHSYQFTFPRVYPKTPLYYWLLNHNALKDGEVNLEELSHQDLLFWYKKAIRVCHFNFSYLWRMLKTPREFMRSLRGAKYVIRNVFFSR